MLDIFVVVVVFMIIYNKQLLYFIKLPLVYLSKISSKTSSIVPHE
jgi:hypothetical protein